LQLLSKQIAQAQERTEDVERRADLVYITKDQLSKLMSEKLKPLADLLKTSEKQSEHL
jgi:hypothetical protein